MKTFFKILELKSIIKVKLFFHQLFTTENVVMASLCELQPHPQTAEYRLRHVEPDIYSLPMQKLIITQCILIITTVNDNVLWLAEIRVRTEHAIMSNTQQNSAGRPQRNHFCFHKDLTIKRSLLIWIHRKLPDWHNLSDWPLTCRDWKDHFAFHTLLKAISAYVMWNNIHSPSCAHKQSPKLRRSQYESSCSDQNLPGTETTCRGCRGVLLETVNNDPFE